MVADREIVQNIAKFIFPLGYEWKKPELLHLVGPYYPEVFDEFDEILEDKRNTLISYIQALPSKEIDCMNWDENSVPYHPNDRLGILEDNPDFMAFYKKLNEPRKPTWFAGGFGNRDFGADLSYWSKIEKFTLVEATCVSIGFQPTEYFEKFLDSDSRTRDKELSRISDSYGNESAKLSIDFYKKRRELIKRKFIRLAHDKIQVQKFYEWITEIELEVPDPLLVELQKRFMNAAAKGSQQPPQEERFENREKQSLAKLVTAMAIDAYGFQPDSARSPIPKEIEDICSRLGLEITDDTIRRYLKLGAKHLPDKWNED